MYKSGYHLHPSHEMQMCHKSVISFSVAILYAFLFRGFAGLASCYDLKDIVQKICHDQDVMSTMIDSTLGRHLLANGQDLCLGEQPMADAAYVTGDATRRGKALIICYENTKGRRKRTGYTTQLSEAYKILSEQFHLVVRQQIYGQSINLYMILID